MTRQQQLPFSLDINDSKYINLLTDYGLKSVLMVNELAIDFLNDLLEDITHIQKISYLDKESIGKYKYQRTAIFDLLCEDDQNREFIVEIQRISQEFFMDRSVYYASARIQNNAPKGKAAFNKWDFLQKPIIFIGILDFDIKDSNPDKFKYLLRLYDTEDPQFLYKKLSFIYLELPKFERLVGSDLLRESANLNKWLYAIRNLHKLKSAPDFLKEGSFKRLLEIAEIANMTKEQKDSYELSLKRLADNYATNKTSRKEGLEEGLKKGEAIGRAKEKLEGIKNLLRMNVGSISQIATAFNVDEAYVLEIKNGMEGDKEK